MDKDTGGRADRWELDYIEDAATVRRSIYRSNGTLFTDRASNYNPPDNGVHLCGVTDDEEQPTTVAAYRMPVGQAGEAWQVAKDVAECEKDAADFVVDLFIDGSCETDFWSNRQLWPRAIEAWNTIAAPASPNSESPHG